MSILTITIAIAALWLVVLSVVVAVCSAAGRADRRDVRPVMRRTASGS